MTDSDNKDPLHGINLKTIVTQLEAKYGWPELGRLIRIKCFTDNPSIASSLKFLRRTPWARQKVETLYLQTDWSKNNVWRQTPGSNKAES